MVVNPCHLFMAPVHLCFRCFQRKKLAQKVNEPGLTGNSIWAGIATDIIKSSFPITSFKKMAPKLTDSDPLWRERCSKVKSFKNNP